MRGAALESAGLGTVGRLLFLLPRRYEDRRTLSSVESLAEEGPVTLQGRLVDLATLRIRRRRLTMVRGRLVTASGDLPVIWFNRPYVASQIDPQCEYLIHGKLQRRSSSWQLVNPTVEPLAKARLAGRVVPVYPSVEGLPPSLIGGLLSALIDSLDLESLSDPVPSELLRRHGLPGLSQALRAIHWPPDDADVASLNDRSTDAHHRLIYGELLRFQLELCLIRRRIGQHRKKHAYASAVAERGRLESSLPFDLTRGQATALTEILADLESPYPMMRLLQGDVGSGKTAVAAIAMAIAAESGLQAAMMAPTELLAEQHVNALRRLLGDRHPIVLLTGSTEERDLARERLQSGSVKLVVGTHALIQDRVGFDSLGLVIIDEQHRFGVGQRRRLQLKGDRPDLLVMTATPIPRSLSLTVYGDLALSVIDDLPPGRQPVATRLASRDKREEICGWLETRLRRGDRAYVVLPFIDESDAVAAGSIEGLGRELAARFGHHRPAVLHGRVDSGERAELMRAFAEGEARVLIATTLVEVGVDVPEANIMIIESAERFGLSQLHQLRGRVGRGKARSYCIAVHGPLSDDARQRLEVFAATRDGFEIAEADLALRGPGELLGTRQAGMPEFRVADLVRDRRWIELARRDALELIAKSPDLARRLAALPVDVSPYGRLTGA